MRLAASPFILFLLFGIASAGLVFSRNADGSFDAPTFENENSKTEEVAANEPVNLVHNLNSTNNGPDNNNTSLSLEKYNLARDHIAKSPLDDDDLELVQEMFKNKKINKTGQLRYSALPLVEKALIGDIATLIMKDEEYMILLNQPSFPDILKMVRSMLREPMQKVLQEQIWSKVLAIEAYYNKYYKPMTETKTKQWTKDFLAHLKNATENHNLTVLDTEVLNEKMKTFAFLNQEYTISKRITELDQTIAKEKDQIIEKPKTSDAVDAAHSRVDRDSNAADETTTAETTTKTPSTVPPSSQSQVHLIDVGMDSYEANTNQNSTFTSPKVKDAPKDEKTESKPTSLHHSSIIGNSTKVTTQPLPESYNKDTFNFEY